MSSEIRDTLRIDSLTVTVSLLSSGVFFVLVLLLLLLIYRRDPLCCRTGCPPHTNAPTIYHSRDTLVDPGLHDDSFINRNVFVHNQPPRGPFIIGKPSDYHLPGATPRLPSYESVRRKDRRAAIHHMIAERFGLRVGATHNDQQPPPPPYEEAFHHTLNIPSLGLRRLEDEPLPALDQDGRRFSNGDGAAASGDQTVSDRR